MMYGSRMVWLTVTLGVLLLLPFSTPGPATAAPAQPGHGHGTSNAVQATPEEQANAARLLADVKAGIAKYASLQAAVADGYVSKKSFGPEARTAHFRNKAFAMDDRILDAARPEGLVYMHTPEGRTVLLGAFFIAPRGQGPRPGGPLTEWHTHNELGRFEMMHVWIVFDKPDPVAFGRMTRELRQAALEYATR
ncbi:MAG: hypothetical protein ACRDIC_14225 [bacterium]